MSALTSRLSAQLSPGLPVQSLKERSPLKDAETVKTEIESLFNQLQGDQQNGGQQTSDDITNSLQTLIGSTITTYTDIKIMFTFSCIIHV